MKFPRRGVFLTPAFLRPVFFACYFPVLFFSLPGALYAQADNRDVFRFPLGPDTLPRFNEINAVLAAHPLIRGTFRQQKTLSRLNRSLVSEGRFIIARDLGMVWETVKPFPSTTTVGRDYLIQSIPGGRKTKLDAAGNETFLHFSGVISAVFAGDAKKLLENFENYFTEERGLWTLGLIPRDIPIRSFAARIIMGGDSVVRTITLYEQSGDLIRYELSGHVFPGALSADEREFFSLP
jgi:hypothetical protein